MAAPAPVPVPEPPPVPAVACDPAHLLRLSRGFSCLFWSLPLLALAHAAALMDFWPARRMTGAALLCFLPLYCGLWMMRLGGRLTPRWGSRVGLALLLAFTGMYLFPFLPWWKDAPTQLYFAVNAALHYFAMMALLAGLNRLAGEAGRWMGDPGLRREAGAGLGMVLWLSGCTVLALVWLFHRAGLLQAGLETLLLQTAQLPGEARYLLLLPYAMTAYVMWRAKETGFRHAMQVAG